MKEDRTIAFLSNGKRASPRKCPLKLGLKIFLADTCRIALEKTLFGPASKILGMEIQRDRKSGTLALSQRRFVEKLL